jgi:hypothetical protein
VENAFIVAGTDRAIQAIEGSGVNRLKRLNVGNNFSNATVRDGIDTAGKAARVYYDSTGPMAQMGFGLKKRSPRKKEEVLYIQLAHIIKTFIIINLI